MDILKCLKCAAENKPTARFCVKCGAGLFEKCPSCEQENDYTVSFCPNCGHHLDEWRQKRIREKEHHPVFEEGQVRFYQNDFDGALNVWSKIPTDLFNLAEKIAETKKKKELYLAAVKKGNRAFNKKSFTEAAEQYNIALQLAAPSEKNRIKEWLKDATEQSASHLLEEQITAAQKFITEGRFKQAIALLEKFQPAHPDNPRIKELLDSARAQSSRQQIDRLISSGQEFFENGQYRNALINWEKASRNVDDATRSLDLIQKISEAQKRLKTKKLIYLGGAVGVTAILLILVIPVIFTRFASPERLYQKALKLESSNRLAEAQTNYEKLIALAPDHLLANDARKRINQISAVQKQAELPMTESPKNHTVLTDVSPAPFGTDFKPQATLSVIKEELAVVQTQTDRLIAEKKYDSAVLLYRNFINKYGTQAEEFKTVAMLETNKIKETIQIEFKKRETEINRLLENSYLHGQEESVYPEALRIWQEMTSWEADFLRLSLKDLGVKILESARERYRMYYENWAGCDSVKTAAALKKGLYYTWDVNEIQTLNQELYLAESGYEDYPIESRVYPGNQLETYQPDSTETIKCSGCQNGRLPCQQCENKEELKPDCQPCNGLGFNFCNHCKGDGVYTAFEEKLRQSVEKFLH